MATNGYRRIQGDISDRKVGAGGYRYIQVDTGEYRLIHVANIDYNMAREQYKWIQVATDGYR